MKGFVEGLTVRSTANDRKRRERGEKLTLYSQNNSVVHGFRYFCRPSADTPDLGAWQAFTLAHLARNKVSFIELKRGFL